MIYAPSFNAAFTISASLGKWLAFKIARLWERRKRYTIIQREELIRA